MSISKYVLYNKHFLLIKNINSEVINSFKVKSRKNIFNIAMIIININGVRYSISAEKDENNNYITPFSYFLFDHIAESNENTESIEYLDEYISSNIILKTKKKVSWNLQKIIE